MSTLTMMQAYDPTSNKREEQQQLGKPQKRFQEDTDEVAASFLLSLKHSRSVTPEPNLDDSDHQARRGPYQSYSSYATYGGDSPYPGHQKRSHSKKQSPNATTMTPQQTTSSCSPEVPPFQSLIDGSKLVLMKDQDLVPDSLFVAMAQMKPCRLTHSDRVGCYKNREIGFLGMSCKHCGGQPGFGRYYPNSVRSLAQTTTSQTILKHIAGKCRFCPPHIRDAVLNLQQQANQCEGISSGRPRYGSRKIFFQRVWARLHDEEINEEDEEGKHIADDLSAQTPTDVDEEPSSDEEIATPASKRKSRFGSLPLQKNKRIKTTVALV
jgi:hypothetical protein